VEKPLSLFSVQTLLRAGAGSWRDFPTASAASTFRGQSRTAHDLGKGHSVEARNCGADLNDDNTDRPKTPRHIFYSLRSCDDGL